MLSVRLKRQKEGIEAVHGETYTRNGQSMIVTYDRRMATPEKAAYVAAKHGVLGFTHITGTV